MSNMDPDRANCIAIPLIWEPGQYHYIYFDKLPEPNEAINMLWCEEAPTNMWLELAVEYKKQGQSESYIQILEASLTKSNSRYEKGSEHLVDARFTLAQFYYELASSEIDAFRQSILYHKANFYIDGKVKGLKRRYGDDVGFVSTSLGKRSRIGSL